VAVTFDCFGTLVDAERPDDPAAAVAAELETRGVDVPGDWGRAYRERHVDAPAGAAVPLPAHVAAALRSRGVEAPGNVPRRAVVAAFDPAVTTREGAPAAVAAAADAGPVGVLSNSAVPGLVRTALTRSALDREAFDAVVTSVGCGWRKPDRRAFEAAADALDAAVGDLVHVGDDDRTDGAVAGAGGTYVDVGDVALGGFPGWLAGREGAEP